MSRCAWESLKVFLQDAVPESDPIPGAVIAIQSFGDFLGFNPHCHILVTDGCFYGNKGMFRVAPPLELKKLEAIFQHKMFRMLLTKGKITEEMVRMLSAWKHSGFHVFCGNRISPNDDTAMENLARYIIGHHAGTCCGSPQGSQRVPGMSSIWIRKGRSFMLPKMASQPRFSRRWNGWPPCVRTSRIVESRWCDITDTTATSHGGNARRKVWMTPSPASLNRRVMKKSSAGTGRGLSKRYMKSIPYYVRNVKGRCGSSAVLRIRR